MCVDSASGLPVGDPTHLPSVTTILNQTLPKQDALTRWAWKLGIEATLDVLKSDTKLKATELRRLIREAGVDEMADAAGNTDHVPGKRKKAGGIRGSDVHRIVEQVLDNGGRLPVVKAEHQPYAQAFRDWYWHRQVRSMAPVRREFPVASFTHGFAGTCDLLLCAPTDHYILCDWKTGRSIYLEGLIQVAAYEGALRERGLIPAGARCTKVVVLLTEQGTFREEVSNYTLDDFLAAKRMWHVLREANERAFA
jgi:hypothetical protein